MSTSSVSYRFLEFEEWQFYDGRRTRTAGQNRDQQQARMVMLHEQDIPREAIQQARVVISSDQAKLEASYQQGGVVNLPAQATLVHQASMVNLPHPEGAKRPRQPAQNGLQMTTHASSEPASGEASSAPLRKGLRKKATKTPDVVFEAQSASPQASGVGDLQELEAGEEERWLLPPDLHLQEARADRNTSGSKTTTPVFSWPARQAHERTDLDFYQRVLRERGSQRVALLIRLAHERIGVPLASSSYARIGALAKQCGAALLVKHILLAAAQHIDGDSLDYLTKLVNNTHRKETHHDARPTISQRPADTASSSRPYNCEEAKQLVWNT